MKTKQITRKPPSKGVYCIVIQNDKDRDIQIGRLGKFNFSEGFYCYVGSAMNNLEARIRRHLSKKKSKKWHIDFLLDKTNVVHTRTIETPKKIECKLSKAIAKLADSTPIKKFGSTDCKCPSHLHYFEMNPTFQKEFHDIFENMIKRF